MAKKTTRSKAAKSKKKGGGSNEKYNKAVDGLEKAVKALYKGDAQRAKEQLERLTATYPEEKELLERVDSYLKICVRQLTPQRRPKSAEEMVNFGVMYLNEGDISMKAMPHKPSNNCRRPSSSSPRALMFNTAWRRRTRWRATLRQARNISNKPSTATRPRYSTREATRTSIAFAARPRWQRYSPTRRSRGLVIYGLRVFAIGGGTGLSALLAGLKQFMDPPPEPSKDDVYFADLSALVTVTDDGGSSGRLRDEFQMLPPGDIRNCLVSLSADESLLSSLFQYRFEGSGDLAGHNFGNLFLTALTGVTGDFSEAVRAASQVLAIRGRIFPSTNQRVSLRAELDDGSLVRGETNITGSPQRVRRVHLQPADCRPPRGALNALSQADLVLIGPGSLYTSLVPNLLVPGVVEAIASSGADVVYLANVMTQPGETTGYTVADHIDALLEHAPGLEISHVLRNSAPVPAKVLAHYREDGAEPVRHSRGDRLPCPIVSEDLLQPGPVVRHDGVKTAGALQSIFHRAHAGMAHTNTTP